VVKANAYGHGTVECSKALQKEGAKWFAVSDCAEGVLLRDSGIKGRILLLGGFWNGEEDAIVEHDLTPLIWEPAQVKLLEHAAKKLDRTEFPIHLKVDTGMARLAQRSPICRRSSKRYMAHIPSIWKACVRTLRPRKFSTVPPRTISCCASKPLTPS